MLSVVEKKVRICLIKHYKYIFDTRDISGFVSDCRLPVSAGLSSVSLGPCDMNILQTVLHTLQNALKNFKLTNKR